MRYKIPGCLFSIDDDMVIYTSKGRAVEQTFGGAYLPIDDVRMKVPAIDLLALARDAVPLWTRLASLPGHYLIPKSDYVVNEEEQVIRIRTNALIVPGADNRVQIIIDGVSRRARPSTFLAFARDGIEINNLTARAIRRDRSTTPHHKTKRPVVKEGVEPIAPATIPAPAPAPAPAIPAPVMPVPAPDRLTNREREILEIKYRAKYRAKYEALHRWREANSRPPHSPVEAQNNPPAISGAIGAEIALTGSLPAISGPAPIHAQFDSLIPLTGSVTGNATPPTVVARIDASMPITVSSAGHITPPTITGEIERRIVVRAYGRVVTVAGSIVATIEPTMMGKGKHRPPPPRTISFTAWKKQMRAKSIEQDCG